MLQSIHQKKIKNRNQKVTNNATENIPYNESIQTINQKKGEKKKRVKTFEVAQILIIFFF